MPNNPDRFDNPDKNVTDLLVAANRIMEAIHNAGTVDLNDPIDMLALQLLGPCLARAMNDDPRMLKATMDNLTAIASQVDVTKLRLLLVQGVPRA